MPIFSMTDKCKYGSMDTGNNEKVAADEGKNIATKYGVSLNECQKLCNEEKGCKSFALCSSTCHLKDKILTGSEPKIASGCTTYYRNCEGNYK